MGYRDRNHTDFDEEHWSYDAFTPEKPRRTGRSYGNNGYYPDIGDNGGQYGSRPDNATRESDPYGRTTQRSRDARYGFEYGNESSGPAPRYDRVYEGYGPAGNQDRRYYDEAAHTYGRYRQLDTPRPEERELHDGSREGMPPGMRRGSYEGY